MKQVSVTFRPQDTKVPAEAGATILEAAQKAGIALNTVCGGKGICRKCAVILEPLGTEVLACQYHLEQDITVRVPAQSANLQPKILVHGIQPRLHLQPSIRKKHIDAGLTDADAVARFLEQDNPNERYHISDKVWLQIIRLGQTMSGAKGFTVVCYLKPDSARGDAQVQEYVVRSAEPGDTTDKAFGVALDIGTTTVVARLLDMSDGRCVGSQACLNPQVKYGDDVVSRIGYAGTADGLGRLHRLIIDCVNELVGRLCRDAGIAPENVYEVCAVGNTTMNHIFLGFPVEQLGRAPYKAFSLDSHDRSAAELGISINPAGNIHTVANIAGFVGSDTTAVALAVGVDSTEQVTLVVDIGTNGEIVLAAADKLYAASCAAGPALEGARITFGGRAADGAIEAVLLDERDIDVRVIGDVPANSICGSGLIDAVAVLLQAGIIDASGRFIEPAKLEKSLSEALWSRLSKFRGQPAFILSRSQTAEQPDICVTQKDIREFQLAKGAIRAGIELLLRKVNLEGASIEHILLAGAFGNCIRPDSVLCVGMLPGVAVECIHFVGNAAASGAEMVLLSQEARTLACRLARRIEYVEIAHQADFAAIFADSMLLSATGRP